MCVRYEEGVSPVFATILMVAITIVLASTIYLMSMHMVGESSSTNMLTGTLTEIPDSASGNSVNFTISMSIPTNAYKSNVKIIILRNHISTTLQYLENKDIWSNATSGGRWHYEAKLIDLNKDGKFGDGDQLWVYIIGNNALSFESGDKVLFSIVGYQGLSMGGEINL